MFKIYSKKNKKKLLHLIHYKKDFNNRTNLIPKSEFLQVSSLQLSKNQTFKPHYHFFIKNKKKK